MSTREYLTSEQVKKLLNAKLWTKIEVCGSELEFFDSDGSFITIDYSAEFGWEVMNRNG